MSKDIISKSEELDIAILKKLKELFVEHKKQSKVIIKEGESKLKSIYDKSQELYKKAIQYYTLGNIAIALVCYELGQMKYSYYLRLKGK